MITTFGIMGSRCIILILWNRIICQFAFSFASAESTLSNWDLFTSSHCLSLKRTRTMIKFSKINFQLLISAFDKVFSRKCLWYFKQEESLSFQSFIFALTIWSTRAGTIRNRNWNLNCNYNWNRLSAAIFSTTAPLRNTVPFAFVFAASTLTSNVRSEVRKTDREPNKKKENVNSKFSDRFRNVGLLAVEIARPLFLFPMSFR
jgi:hypothetical protein